MISFFRRALSSWIALGLLALIMIAFIITGVERPGMTGDLSGAGPVAAKAGDTKVTAGELIRRVQNQFEGARREQPSLDQKAFLANDRFESITNALIGARALESWGREQGLAISKRLIDAQVAAIPAFAGLSGKFDESVMRNTLAQARISEKEMRADMASDLIRGQILTPVSAAAPVPLALAKDYASLLLEMRSGSVAIIPLGAVADPRVPTDAEIAAAYKADIAAYTRPEARVLHYAVFGPAQVAALAVPTEAEVAAYYQDNAATYAARETRTLTQVITPSEAVAKGIAAGSGGGAGLAAAAAKAGLEASTIGGKTRAEFAGQSSDAIAAAAFSAAKGSMVGPVKGAFGWYVLRVDAVTGVPARSLAQAKPEIVAALTVQKAKDALSELSGKIEDAVADGASFAEVAANNKLTVVDSPAIVANGQAIDQPGWKAPAELAALLKSGFAADPADRPSVETLVKDEQFALLSVSKVIPPTPLPLARVRPMVVRDIIIKRTALRAKAVGDKIVIAVNKGVPLAKAIADTGIKLPPPQPTRARQLDLARAAQSGAQIPGPVRALFGLRPGKAKLVPGDRPDVMFVTVLETVTPGNPATMPGLIENTRSELSRSLTPELGEQFMRSVEQDVQVKRYPDVIAAAKRQFASGK